ncbi:MAG: hypothetical protein K0R49_37 [Burkholderiales bacterium]|jgi:hypothetical protein|nr:hypothetical protein [Burkholderiales bacterium]MCE3267785.1 hypothetical protein [Burkholderiales bacterium]
MLKIISLFILSLNIASVSAQTDQASTAMSKASAAQGADQSVKNKKHLKQNNPAVGGSRQVSSEQMFGKQKISNSKKVPHEDKGGAIQNNPAVGGRQAGSEQLFGQGSQVPEKKQRSSNPHMNKVNFNNPAVGGRQAGSEQLFGQSATPHN